MQRKAGSYITKNVTVYAKRISTNVISKNARLNTSENLAYWWIYADPKLTTKLGSLVSRISAVPQLQHPNKNIEFIIQHGTLDKAYKGVPAGPYTIIGSSDDNDVITKGFAGQITGANSTTSGSCGTFVSTVIKSNPKTVVVKIDAVLSILKK